MKIKSRIEAASLAYALLLILIVSIVSLSVILLNQFRIGFVNKAIAQSRIIDNSYSGLNFISSVKFRGDSYHFIGDLFGNTKDSVEAYARFHGVFQVNTIDSYTNDIHYYNACFSGPDSKLNYGLYLGESRYSLKIAGETRLKGGVVVPNAKIDRANIKEHNYTGSKMYWGSLKESTSFFPPLSKSFNERINVLNRFVFQTHANYFLNKSDSLDNSFNADIAFIKDEELIEIQNVYLADNIIISSKKEIRIFANSNVRNVVFVAPIVRIETGFKGVIQVIASDSILIGADVTLNFPSALVCSANEESNSGIIAEENCVVKGIIHSNVSSSKAHVKMEFKSGFLLEGVLYNYGNTSLKEAEIRGQLITKTISYPSKSNRDINVLLDVQIDPDMIPGYVMGVNFLATNPTNKIFLWH